MKTFDKKTKKFYLDQAIFRRENDLFEQGQWLNKNKSKNGVFCGCMHGSLTQLDDNVLSESSKALGWPLWLTYLSERCFEGLPYQQAMAFPERLIDVVPVNVSHNDFDKKVRPKIEIWRLENLKTVQLKNDYSGRSEIIKVLEQCIDVWKIEYGSQELLEAARSAAWSAAWSAARSAARSAESAARSAESAARSAAWSAAESAESAESSAWSAESAALSAAESARSAAWSDESEYLIAAIKAEFS